MNVVLVPGHPGTDSLCARLFRAYREGATDAARTDVSELGRADLEFDPDVTREDPSGQRLELPNWWGRCSRC